MNESLFTRLKDVEAFGRLYHERHGRSLDFHTIVRQLYSRDVLSHTPMIFRRSKKTLSDSDFCLHALEQVIDAGSVLSNQHLHNVNEEYGFSEDKDIYTMVTLPYIYSENHTHDYYEILYVYEGNCTYFFKNISFELHKGQLLILSPDTPHHIDMADGGLGLAINIRKSTFRNTFNALLSEHNLLSAFFVHTLDDASISNYITFDIENTDEYNYLIQQIFDESNSRENYSNMVCVSLLNLFFGKLLQDFGKTIHLYSDVNNISFNRMFPLMLKYVQSNYATITLPKMAEIFHYNESYISSLFKKYLHENFSSIVQTLRLEEARHLMETTDDTLEQISGMIGYTSVDHFSRIFKKKYGCTPSAYRKTIKR